MADWTVNIWETFKTIAPWISGGLAGAILTYILGQRSARRKMPRLLVKTERIDYTIPARDEALQGFRVWYQGKSFDNLMLFQLEVGNVSRRSTKSSPFLLTLPQNARIADRSSLVKPVNRDPHWDDEKSGQGAYVWDPGELRPDDTARLRLLVTPAGDVGWRFRGDDDIEIVSYDDDTRTPFDRDRYKIILAGAIFVLLGDFPIFGDMLQALLIVVLFPFVVSRAQRWFAVTNVGRKSTAASPIVINGTSAHVAIVHDNLNGRSLIKITPETGKSPSEEIGSGAE